MDLKNRNWKQCDFIIISGDAYVDHPSFGHAVIGRWLEHLGFKVGIVAQPQSDEDYMNLGEPSLAWLVTSGNMDSMVNHYTANNKIRREDSFSPGGKAGLRPNRAVLQYCSTVKKMSKGIPVIIGGIEASLRRLVHYDYWSNKVRRSILLDSKADLLIYGMAERSLRTVAEHLKNHQSLQELPPVPGTVFAIKADHRLSEHAVAIPSYEDIVGKPKLLGEAFNIQSRENNPFNGKPLIQKHDKRAVIQMPPAIPLSRSEMDEVYNLPYLRKAHPIYDSSGGVPALKEVLFSLTSSRGCFGGCSFCAITFHQGEIVQSRSHQSLVAEAQALTHHPQFKGQIHDVGGPTANFRNPSCDKQSKYGPCMDKKCLYPKACSNLNSDHSDYTDLLSKIRSVKGVKKVFIRSGIRYDFILNSDNQKFVEDLCKYHVSGQLKVAPEHVSSKVLSAMGKPVFKLYEQFKKLFDKTNENLNKKQYLIPYLIASHPGTGLKEAVELALKLKQLGFVPQQVQDFYPTPGTLSSIMYYTGIDPRTENKIHVPRGDNERAMLRALLQYNRPENYELVCKALNKAGRQDLIGYGPHALVTPKRKSSKRKRK